MFQTTNQSLLTQFFRSGSLFGQTRQTRPKETFGCSSGCRFFVSSSLPSSYSMLNGMIQDGDELAKLRVSENHRFMNNLPYPLVT